MSLLVPSRRRFLGLSAAALGLFAAGDRLAFAGTGTPTRGGTLNILGGAEPPVLTGISSPSSTDIGPKVVEGLLHYDYDLKPLPLLATDWSVSDDGLNYKFTLRRGVKWHDGKDFTAADVAYSIATLKEIHPRGRVTFANLADIGTPDDFTVTLKLSKPAPYLLTALGPSETPIVPRHLYEGTDAAANPINSAPIGTGPWLFKEWVRGSHVLYERNPNYWIPDRPYLDRLIVHYIPDPAARSIAIENGEVDIAPRAAIPYSDFSRLTALPNIAISDQGYQYYNNVLRLEFNLDKPYFKDQRVREAFAHVIDRKVVHNTINYGYGDPIPGPVNSHLTKFYDGTLPTYDIDLKKAEALLDAAGFPRGADGTRFSIVHDFSPNGDHMSRGADYFKQALGRVGVKVSVRTQDFPTFIKRVYTDRDFDFQYNSVSNLFDPTVGIQRLYWSKNFKPGIAFSNGSHYSSPKVDALLEAAAVEVDPKKRFQQFVDFQKEIIADLPDITLLNQPDVTVYNKRVAGHTNDAVGATGDLADAYLTDLG